MVLFPIYVQKFTMYERKVNHFPLPVQSPLSPFNLLSNQKKGKPTTPNMGAHRVRGVARLGRERNMFVNQRTFFKSSELFYQILQSEADNEHNL